MAIKYTKLFRNECEGKFGVSRAVVKDVIEMPDKEQRLASQGLTIIINSKKIKKGDYMLAITHIQGEDQMVDLAFRAKAELVEQAKSDLPLTLMRVLAFKTGLPVRIGERESKFIYNEVIPVSSSEIKKAISILNPEKHPLISSIWVRIIHNNMGPLAQCALVFCIDERRYRAWLGGK